jgi:serine O-acetyltransferase
MLKILSTLLLGAGSQRVGLLLKWANLHARKGNPRISKILLLLIERQYGVYIGQDAQIGEQISFPHPVGIVIGNGVKIGDNCVIYQGVTLGGARKGDAQSGHYPIVGDNTIIYAGSVIIGAIEIGSNCIIGANAVITKNVPNGHVAVGVPASWHPRKDFFNG